MEIKVQSNHCRNRSICTAYRYGPFGELIRATGPMAKANPFRFSTRYQDEETGLVYYGYRYYDPGTGRWVSRDPLGEA
ncbi:MAG TPA: RHS repeat-associated core domain-containing protein, partial [Candidatus Paceibacterota bacterium]|nr:RHS repeat-associated core domain-containing protein [Candidatus Paceibacterota bacterium]